MTAVASVSVPESQQSSPQPVRLAAGAEVQTLELHQARSLRAAAAMQLRVLRGRAWVTLGTGPGGWLEASGDALLHAGQCLQVQAGQQAVLEPLGGEPLHYQWRRAGADAPAARPAACAAQPQACGA
ncbi:DUF2917 domain-containing protein [Pulveribacter suum]|uniref:DUF2917 domain-containing protein n=1 Tax=Pulveribacter suum TaxID=2116657 RepID=A0A2P1NP16_9BURK|nr:DUF2917 domain-containing protein [Pulveribacter suum]AVP58798.1 hypothetical protein C7H73_14735 [Pulveribacter suum]